ncbi:MAG: hypothetical protein EAZ57_10860 [Cytophagales bacterium]|nr:MAG: hypothetical protein EAZ67_12725 [Cytophagales bacterium]TAF59472.1 MAG: hypothetical protein EAZ57_10860 [Cytophagales bacterium]
MRLVNRWQNWLFRLVIGLLFVIGSLAFCLEPVESLPYTLQPFYASYQQKINALAHIPLPATQDSCFKAGWAQESILPSLPTPIAGYTPRDAYTSVRDTPCVKVLVLRLGQQKVALVSIDLLIFPPNVHQLLADSLRSTSWDISELYVGATHTHSGMGGWADGMLGRFMAGAYQDNLPRFLVQKIMLALRRAEQHTRLAELSMAQCYASDLLNNRISSKPYETFGLLQTLEIKQDKGEKALWCVFGAHATCLSRHSLALCADYPAVLSQELKQKAKASMVGFMAGAVGSQNPNEFGLKDFELIDALGKKIAQQVHTSLQTKTKIKPSRLHLAQLPLGRVPLRLRLSENWQLRSWIFDRMAASQSAQISVLALGDWLWLGYPADFSGALAAQLWAELSESEQRVVFTSFNGAYLGYVVPDHYLKRYERHETREMNWIGGQTGSLWLYLSRALIQQNTKKQSLNDTK